MSIRENGQFLQVLQFLQVFQVLFPKTHNSQTILKNYSKRNTPKLILWGHHHPETKTRQITLSHTHTKKKKQKKKQKHNGIMLKVIKSNKIHAAPGKGKRQLACVSPSPASEPRPAAPRAVIISWYKSVL